ncbi:HAMP domain-containing sensor histidine kinase [Persicobacter diffluens]|uniref:histidine kinase n=1 Tax=Persicobacter diffluens TaxID=981 RepID=A0AAN4W3F7_9BACT|nr:hypothetical protein PEDI_41090 [Persicobacter diffluens]
MFSAILAENNLTDAHQENLLQFMLPATIVLSNSGEVIGSAGRFADFMDWFEMLPDSQQEVVMFRLSLWVHHQMEKTIGEEIFVVMGEHSDVVWELRLSFRKAENQNAYLSLSVYESFAKPSIIAREKDKLTDEIELLNEQVRFFSTFAYSSAHDLKGPVNTLKGLLQLLQLSDDDATRNEAVRRIGQTVGRVESSLFGMLEIFKTEQKARQAPVKEISFTEMFESIEEKLQGLIADIKPKIFYSFQKDLIVYNELCLEIVLQNVLSNAIKYSKVAGREPEVRVKSKMVGEFLLVKISDKGIGIDMVANKREVGKPFKRFNRDIEGTGVGLFMVYSLMERNGGRVEISSKPGRGTTVDLYFKQANLERGTEEMAQKVAFRMTNIKKAVRAK